MLDKADIVICLGKSTSGKTVKARKLIEDKLRVLIFDTMGHDYTDGVVFNTLQSLKKFWSRCYRDNFRLIYRPFDEEKEFDQVCRLVSECGDLYFVVEEMDLFARPNAVSFGLRNIIKRGRHVDLHFIGTSQRPFGIDRVITALATEAYIFRIEEPRDLEYLGDRFGQGIIEKIKSLQDYEFVKCVQGSTIYEIGKDRI